LTGNHLNDGKCNLISVDKTPQLAGSLFLSGAQMRTPLLARFCRKQAGRACPLCPSISDLFRDRQGVIHLDAEVSDGAFDFGVAEAKLHGS
jgi:hypothetical protein